MENRVCVRCQNQFNIKDKRTLQCEICQKNIQLNIKPSTRYISRYKSQIKARKTIWDIVNKKATVTAAITLVLLCMYYYFPKNARPSITKRVVVENTNQQRQRFPSTPPTKQYHIPKTLSKLIANDQEFDFAMACLLIARSSIQDLFHRDIDIQKPLREIDTIANDIQQKIHNNLSANEVIQVIAHHLYQKMNYTSSRNIWDHSNLYLNLVLEGRQGYCLGFVQLWLSLGERLCYQGKKLPLYGTVLPDHIFVRWDDGKTKINIETLHLPQKIKEASSYDKVTYAPAQNISNDEYIKRYQVSEFAVQNQLYLSNLTRKEVLGCIFYNQSFLNRLQAKKLRHSKQRTTIMQYVARDILHSNRLYPNSYPSYELIAISSLFDRGHFSQALHYANKCIAMDPKSHLHLVAIQSHMSMGNYKQALQCIEKARDLLPQKSIDLAMLQADVYRLSGQYNQSIKFCDSYINSHRGHHIDSYILMTIKKIRCYTQMKQYKKAYVLCEFALQSKIRSYYPDIYPKMGIIHVHMGNFSEANKYFDKSAQIDYCDSEVFYGKALIAMQKKQYKKALAYLEEAMAYNATDIDVLRAFKELQKLSRNNTP